MTSYQIKRTIVEEAYVYDDGRDAMGELDATIGAHWARLIRLVLVYVCMCCYAPMRFIINAR